MHAIFRNRNNNNKNTISVNGSDCVERAFQEARFRAELAKQKSKANVLDEETKTALAQVVEYLHHASGKNGFALPGISLDLLQRWVVNGNVRTVNDMMRGFYGDRMEDNNYNYHKVHINDFVNAFSFPTIAKSNVKEFATGIFKYLLSNDQKYLSQLKGKRLQSFLEASDKIADARMVIPSKYSLDNIPENKLIDVGYQAIQ